MSAVVLAAMESPERSEQRAQIAQPSLLLLVWRCSAASNRELAKPLSLFLGQLILSICAACVYHVRPEDVRQLRLNTSLHGLVLLHALQRPVPSLGSVLSLSCRVLVGKTYTADACKTPQSRRAFGS